MLFEKKGVISFIKILLSVQCFDSRVLIYSADACILAMTWVGFRARATKSEELKAWILVCKARRPPSSRGRTQKLSKQNIRGASCLRERRIRGRLAFFRFPSCGFSSKRETARSLLKACVNLRLTFPTYGMEYADIFPTLPFLTFRNEGVSGKKP